MKLLGLDLETTGLSFEKDRIIEIGAVLWDTEAAIPLRMISTLVYDPQAPIVSPEIQGLTGISQGMLESYGRSTGNALAELRNAMLTADAVVAHNGTGFDRPMLEAHIARDGALYGDLGMPAPEWPQLPWIDTCIDVPYPERITTRKLMHLAAEHGFVNPFAHRAVFDVLTMLTVLQRYPIAGVLESAQQPTVTLIAMVTYEAREMAKARGYRWHAETRTWRRMMKAPQAEAEIADCGFTVRLLEDEELPTQGR